MTPFLNVWNGMVGCGLVGDEVSPIPSLASALREAKISQKTEGRQLMTAAAAKT
jgi:hypothetical protein